MIGTDRAARYRLVEMTAFRCRFFPVDGAVPLGGGDALQGDSSMAEQRRVALVTGCGKPDGIGAAIARKLSADGHVVVVVDIEATGLRDSHEPADSVAKDWRGVESLVAELEGAGGVASAATGDISVENDVERIIAHAVDRHGGLDILVNNAGAPFSLGHGDIAIVNAAEFDRVMAINVRGTFLMGQAAARVMRPDRKSTRLNSSH